MSLAAYLDRHGWHDEPFVREADARGAGSPSRLRLSQPPTPRKGAVALDPLGLPFAARLSHANVLFNEEFGIPVPPGSRANSTSPFSTPSVTPSPTPDRLRMSEPPLGSSPLGTPRRLPSCSPDLLRRGEASGSPLCSPKGLRSKSVGGSRWPTDMPTVERPPVRPSAPTGLFDSARLPSPRASRNLSPEIGVSGSPGSSGESSVRQDDWVTQPVASNAASSLGLATAATSFVSKVGKSLEQRLEGERRLLDKKLAKESREWQQQQQPVPVSWAGVRGATHFAMALKQGVASTKDATSPGDLRRPPTSSSTKDAVSPGDLRRSSCSSVKDAVSPGALRRPSCSSVKDAVTPAALRRPSIASSTRSASSSEQHSSEQHSSDGEQGTTSPSLPLTSKWLMASERLVRGRDATEAKQLSMAWRVTGALNAPFRAEPMSEWSELRLRQRQREVQSVYDVYETSQQRQRSSFEDVLKAYYPSATRTELREMVSWTVKEEVETKRVYTAEELAEIKSMFKELDKDRGGTLELEELVAAGWGGETDEEQADFKRTFDEIDEDGDGSIDIEGFTRLVTECKLLDGDIAAPTPTAATSTDIERTRTSRRPELTRRPSLAMLSAKETVDRVEQLRLEASKAAALVETESGRDSESGQSA